MAKVEITLKRSHIKRNKTQVATVKALGLKKTSQSIVKDVNPQIQGMIDSIAHLLEVKSI